MWWNGRSRPSRVWMPDVWSPSYGSRPSYDRRQSYYGPRLRQRRKERDPGWARQKRKNRVNRMTRKMVIRGWRRPERILREPTRTQSKTTTSPMGRRMLIRTPSRAVAVLMQTNVRATEAMGTRMKSRLRRRMRSRMQRRKR